MRARCLRHCRADKPQRWHIDYLTSLCTPREIWHSTQITESEIVARLERDEALERPVPGFGASDSAALSHLFRAARREHVPDLIDGMIRYRGR